MTTEKGTSNWYSTMLRTRSPAAANFLNRPLSHDQETERHSVLEGTRGDYAAQGIVLTDPVQAKYFEKLGGDFRNERPAREQQNRLNAAVLARNERLIDGTPTFTRIWDLVRSGYHGAMSRYHGTRGGLHLEEALEDGVFDEEEAADFVEYQQSMQYHQREAARIPVDPGLLMVTEKGGWKEAVKYLARNPSAIGSLIAQSAAPSAPSLAAGVIGGAMGIPAGPGGVLLGSMMGAGGASAAVDYFTRFEDALSHEAGVDLMGMKPEAAVAFMQSPEGRKAFKAAHDRALRGATIMGIASGLSGSIGAIPFKAGSAVGKVVEAPVRVSVAGGMEGVGEAGAQLATTDAIDETEVVFETAAGAGVAVAEQMSLWALRMRARQGPKTQPKGSPAPGVPSLMKMAEADADNPMRTEAPAKYRQYIDEMGRQGQAPESVKVSAEDLVAYAQEADLSIADLAQGLNIRQSEITRAIEMKGFLDVKVSDLLVRDDAVEILQSLQKEVKMRTDDFTATEVDERIEAGQQPAEEFDVKEREVYDRIYNAVLHGGRTHEEARANAKIVERVVGTLAREAARRGLPITAPEILRQGLRQVVNEDGEVLDLFPEEEKVTKAEIEEAVEIAEEAQITGDDVETETASTFVPPETEPEIDITITEQNQEVAEEVAKRNAEKRSETIGAETPVDPDVQISITEQDQQVARGAENVLATGRRRVFPKAPEDLGPALKEFAQEHDSRALYNPTHRVIYLSANADASSFIHESAHVWLTMMEDLHKEGGLAKDLQEALVEAIGAESIEGISTDKVFQERFAEGFEQYLARGKAPKGVGLRKVFKLFRRWLTGIYVGVKEGRYDQIIREGGLTLNDEVIALFDRMLVGEVATEALIGEGVLGPDVKPEYMTDAEWKEVKGYRDDAREEARANMLSRTIKDVKRRKRRMRKAAAEDVQRQVEEEMRKEDPAWKAAEFLAQSYVFGDSTNVTEEIPDARAEQVLNEQKKALAKQPKWQVAQFLGSVKPAQEFIDEQGLAELNAKLEDPNSAMRQWLDEGEGSVVRHVVFSGARAWFEEFKPGGEDPDEEIGIAWASDNPVIAGTYIKEDLKVRPSSKQFNELNLNRDESVDKESWNKTISTGLIPMLIKMNDPLVIEGKGKGWGRLDMVEAFHYRKSSDGNKIFREEETIDLKKRNKHMMKYKKKLKARAMWEFENWNDPDSAYERATKGVPEWALEIFGEGEPETNHWVEFAQYLGKDGVIFKNITDIGRYGDIQGIGSNVYVSLKPGQIRDIRAKFDPSRFDDPNMFAQTEVTDARAEQVLNAQKKSLAKQPKWQVAQFLGSVKPAQEFIDEQGLAEVAAKLEDPESNMRKWLDEGEGSVVRHVVFSGTDTWFEEFKSGGEQPDEAVDIAWASDNPKIAWSYAEAKSKIEADPIIRPSSKQFNELNLDRDENVDEESWNKAISTGVIPILLKINDPLVVQGEGKSWGRLSGVTAYHYETTTYYPRRGKSRTKREKTIINLRSGGDRTRYMERLDFPFMEDFEDSDDPDSDYDEAMDQVPQWAQAIFAENQDPKTRDWVEFAHYLGKDGIIFENIKDPATNDVTDIAANTYVSLKPGQIRDLRADFDPARYNESNLFAQGETRLNKIDRGTLPEGHNVPNRFISKKAGEGIPLEEIAVMFDFDGPQALMDSLAKLNGRTDFNAEAKRRAQRILDREDDTTLDEERIEAEAVASLATAEAREKLLKAEIAILRKRRINAVGKAAARAVREEGADTAETRKEETQEAKGTEDAAKVLTALETERAANTERARVRSAVAHAREASSPAGFNRIRRREVNRVRAMKNKDIAKKAIQENRNEQRRAATQSTMYAVKGDWQAAEAAKVRELRAHFAAQAIASRMDETREMKRYLKKVAKRSWLKGTAGDKEMSGYALGLAREFGFSTERPAITNVPSGSWYEDQRAIGYDMQEPPSRNTWDQMSYKDSKQLYDAVRSIVYNANEKARNEGEVAKAERAALVQGVEDNATIAKRTDREELGRVRGGVRDFMDHAYLSHRKAENLFLELDGMKEGGPLWQALFRPVNDATNAEAVKRTELIPKIKPLSKVYKTLNKSRKTEVAGLNLSRDQRIALALNWGNEGNRLAILNGSRGPAWTEDAIMANLNTLTDEEWDFVENVWNVVNSYWDEIAALERRVTGIVPEKVEGMVIELDSGRVIQGQYYPIMFDPNLTPQAAGDQLADLAKDTIQGRITKAATKRGHTKERVGSQGSNKRVFLSVDGMFRHLDRVIHDLTHREAVREVARTLEDRGLKTALGERYGPQVSSYLESWLKNVASGPTEPRTLAQIILRHLRVGMTMYAMGFSFRTALVQPMGFANTIARLGPAHALGGLMNLVGSSKGLMVGKVQWVSGKSAFMDNRMKEMDRDINAAIRRMKPGTNVTDKIKDGAFWMIGMLDLVVANATWMGAYQKASAEGKGEREAVEFADQTVRATQGSGRVIDQAAISTGGEAERLFTAFYTFFSALHNLLTDTYRRMGNVKREKGLLPASVYGAVQFFAIIIAPAILTKMILDGSPEDDDEWLAWAMKTITGYAMGGMIGLRDIGLFLDTGFDYTGPPSTQGIAAVTRVYQQAEQGEIDKALVKSTITAGGILTHMPGVQMNRFYEAWYRAEYEGADWDEIAAVSAGLRHFEER